MSLPFEHKRSFEIEDSDWNVISKKVIKELTGKSEVQLTDDTIRFNLFTRITGIKFPFVIYIEKEGSETYFYYCFEFSRLVRIIVYAIIICAVLSIRSIPLFLITAGLFSSSLYFWSMFDIQGQINGIISKAVIKKENSSIHLEEISDEQSEWMQDLQRCPGCGFYLSPVDFECPDCGLKMKSHKDIPVSHTNKTISKIRYTIKQKPSE